MWAVEQVLSNYTPIKRKSLGDFWTSINSPSLEPAPQLSQPKESTNLSAGSDNPYEYADHYYKRKDAQAASSSSKSSSGVLTRSNSLKQATELLANYKDHWGYDSKTLNHFKNKLSELEKYKTTNFKNGRLKSEFSFRLAQAYAANGKLDPAIDLLDNQFVDSEVPHLHRHMRPLSIFLRFRRNEEGDVERAERDIVPFLKYCPSPATRGPFLKDVATALQEKGDTARGLTYLQKAIDEPISSSWKQTNRALYAQIEEEDHILSLRKAPCAVSRSRS